MYDKAADACCNRNGIAPVPHEQFSPWTLSREKRICDLALALLITLITSWMMALIALLVTITSPGPALFRQHRVGRTGREFELLKFRTMRYSTDEPGSCVTQETDQRITSFGRWLRRSKLDELPQLFNVLRGDMSLIGPRPDLSKYLTNLATDLRPIALLTPGITSPASIAFRDEERMLRAIKPSELETYYVSMVLPKKIKLDLDYFKTATWRSDLRMVVTTGAIVLFGHARAAERKPTHATDS